MSDDDDRLIEQAAAGDAGAMGELFARCRDRLRVLVRLRMDRRLQGRVDPSDVLQEACLEASQRIGEYGQKRPMPFYLWMRFLTVQRLLMAHRHHLGTKMRDAQGELSLSARSAEAQSESMAWQLVGTLTAPDQAAIRSELQAKLQQALDSMDATDREILALRHFEQLSNSESAEILGLSPTAASNRYVRALGRLREVLQAMGLSME